MTIEELYNWGKKNNALDYDIAINDGFASFSIQGILDFNIKNTEIDRENKLVVMTDCDCLDIDIGL